MIHELSPYRLTWDEVDPARHPFDRAAVAEVVRGLGPAGRVPWAPDAPRGPEHQALVREHGRFWGDAMAYALARHYGDWALGWRWALAEGDIDGGPIGSWCCPPHSIGTPEETLTRVAEALCEWRDWLEDLADRFEASPLELAEVADQRILWENVSRRLIAHVADRTEAGSAWYGHCRQVLGWFLARWGVAPDTAQRLVDEAVGGRFRSWTAPEPPVLYEVAERLAESLTPELGRWTPAPGRDHLEDWLRVRETVPWHETRTDGGSGPVAPERDGAAEDIRAFDLAIDRARGEGLLAALEQLRADAARGAALDFELLSSWQQHVLGTSQPPPFRTLTAFAKGGRERYGIGPGTRARLDACLAGSADVAGLPLAVRAARAYLDVCFFHPFDDGNARAGFLAMVFVLAREGCALDSVLLLRRTSYRADAPQDALGLAGYVAAHLAWTREKAVTA
ncbi:Fic family protein [Kitasatospora sp. NPDC051853]|uniref:Fic family protein n=1 Tax=Kitasatospora sp. NPDC051853 TaxID=3364058 RepID=UPI0037AC8E7A